MINFEVIIMSRDRPEYLEKCLDSVLNQIIKFDSVIISDNSLNNSFTKKIEKKNSESIKFIYRNGNLNIYEHFRVNFNETKSNYLLILHDDDFLDTNYLQQIKKFIKKNPNFGLVGTNGFYFNNKNKKENYKQIFKIDESIINYKLIEKKILYRYLDYDLGGVAPFSSYVYNVKKFKNSQIILPSLSRCGYVDDAAFLIQSSKFLELYWINKKITFIRRHNKSATSISLLDYKLFVSYVSQKFEKNLELAIKLKKFRFFSFLSKRRLITKKNIKIYFKVCIFLLLKSSYFRYLIFNKIWKF